MGDLADKQASSTHSSANLVCERHDWHNATTGTTN